tara:strand:- start:1116 stop:1514 length:399 start_codon:yes stop_codon:yes gene_type:complete
MIQKFIYKGKVYAEVIRKSMKSDKTKFFSDSKSSFQFGFVAHKKGYSENPHYHKKILRKIYDCQQMLFVQKGKIKVKFFSRKKKLIKIILIKKGDAINIIQGIHAINILENAQCITVKQGPFISEKMDKVDV